MTHVSPYIRILVFGNIGKTGYTEQNPITIIWNQWKIFEKMTEDHNYDRFWGPKWPEIGSLRPIFNTPIKVAQIKMYTKTDTKPMGICLENSQRLEYLLIYGAQSGLQIEPLRPIFSTFLTIICKRARMWKLFEKVTKHQNVDLLWGPKWPRNWAFEAHIIRISERSSNEHV